MKPTAPAVRRLSLATTTAVPGDAETADRQGQEQQRPDTLADETGVIHDSNSSREGTRIRETAVRVHSREALARRS
jgi:hypothetical protein